VSGQSQKPLDAGWLADELGRLARIAAGILDGDEVRDIITPRAMHHIANPTPGYRFLSADYYDVEHEPFGRCKKLLMRIERLIERPGEGPNEAVVNGSLWVPVPGTDCVTVALHNGPHHRYYRFGMARLDTPAEMQRVFETGEVVVAPPHPAGTHVTVLAPVRDSLGDVAAVCELTAPLDPTGPAWE